MEDDDPSTSQFAMSEPFTLTHHSNTQFNGRSFQVESQDVQLARTTLANKYREQGLTFKHAWYKAFQEHPRVYLDELAPPPAPSARDCDAGQTFFDPRV